MKRYFLKLALLAFPLVLLAFLELFILPMDFFTFRVWEALKVSPNSQILSGPFYPNQIIAKMEEGDLAPHTQFAVKKQVLWETDSYGYRKKEGGGAPYDVIIIGDSNTVGSGLTQDDTLSEVLERKLHCQVYPFAPTTVNDFIQCRRFVDNPPKVVVFECMERGMTTGIQPVRAGDVAGYNKIVDSPWFKPAAVFFDRLLYKKNMFHYCEARLREWVTGDFGPNKQIWANDQSMLFLQGIEANKDVPSEEIRRVVDTIKGYDAYFRQNNVRFIFLPLPNKENVYYTKITGSSKPVFLEKLIAELRKEGIEVIDTQRAFAQFSVEHPQQLLFHSDDTHWNSTAVLLAADLLAVQLNKGRSDVDFSIHN